jgi:hypothetical protein
MNNDDLLDLFAGMALQGMLLKGVLYPAADYAKQAYVLADAMIAEREKRLERQED